MDANGDQRIRQSAFVPLSWWLFLLSSEWWMVQCVHHFCPIQGDVSIITEVNTSLMQCIAHFLTSCSRGDKQEWSTFSLMTTIQRRKTWIWECPSHGIMGLFGLNGFGCWEGCILEESNSHRCFCHPQWQSYCGWNFPCHWNVLFVCHLFVCLAVHCSCSLVPMGQPPSLAISHVPWHIMIPQPACRCSNCSGDTLLLLLQLSLSLRRMYCCSVTK